MEPLENIIREGCTETFEGIPCDYPNCTCSPENRKEMEERAKRVTSPDYDGTY